MASPTQAGGARAQPAPKSRGPSGAERVASDSAVETTGKSISGADRHAGKAGGPTTAGQRTGRTIMPRCRRHAAGLMVHTDAQIGRRRRETSPPAPRTAPARRSHRPRPAQSHGGPGGFDPCRSLARPPRPVHAGPAQDEAGSGRGRIAADQLGLADQRIDEFDRAGRQEAAGAIGGADLEHQPLLRQQPAIGFHHG